MLQYITQYPAAMSIDEQTRIAIDAGCQWIILRMDGADDNEMRPTAQSVADICREAMCMLTIYGHPELTMELRVHGIHLPYDSTMNAIEAREYLGPHAVVGAEVNSADDIEAFRKRDIDYVAVSIKEPFDAYKPMIDIASDAEMPIVATGDFNIDDIPHILNAGFRGVMMGNQLDSDHKFKKALNMLAQ